MFLFSVLGCMCGLVMLVVVCLQYLMLGVFFLYIPSIRLVLPSVPSCFLDDCFISLPSGHLGQGDRRRGPGARLVASLAGSSDHHLPYKASCNSYLAAVKHSASRKGNEQYSKSFVMSFVRNLLGLRPCLCLLEVSDAFEDKGGGAMIHQQVQQCS